jgi:hypothetical protein
MAIILYTTENIRRVNQQITDEFNRKAEMLEDELLKLTNLLILDGIIFKHKHERTNKSVLSLEYEETPIK